jgi:LemA protein
VSPELKLLGENHPELKADTVFSTLMNAITQLENELALMRESYNDAVNSYHTRLDSFPDLIFKRLFRIHKLSYVH